MEENYRDMTLMQLRAVAKEKGLKGISSLKKDQLINRLLEEAGQPAKDSEDRSQTIPATTAAGLDPSLENQDRPKSIPSKEPVSQNSSETGGRMQEDKKVLDRQSTNRRIWTAKDNPNKDNREIRQAPARREASVKESRPGQSRRETSDRELRPDYRIESHSDNRRDFRPDYHPESRSDNRRDFRPDYRPEPRSDNRREVRSGNRMETGPEIRREARPDYRMEAGSEARREIRPGSRMETGTDMLQRDLGPAVAEEGRITSTSQEGGLKAELASLDSGDKADGILEVMPDGYGFIRCENYLPGENDVYVSPSQIRRFNMKTGDIVAGNIRVRNQNERYSALLYVESINGMNPYDAQKRKNFEDLTPVFPNQKIILEYPQAPVSMRMVDLLSPIGRGQRGMIVSQPKTGKTTLIKQMARSITTNYPDMRLIILLIDERPEEVTDIREYIEAPSAEVIYSTFDELPEHHRRVSEMVLERAKRLVEHKKDVVILLDSITRLARAYNLIVPPSGRTLSGGLDPAALHMPKKFFGAARNMREGGSLTVLATALVDTGSKMDDVVFEEFKGTGNMELVLDRKLSEKRIFPAINIQKSGTRRDDLLLTKEEQEVLYALHREMSGTRADENMEQIINFFKKTKNNQEFIETMKKSLLSRRS